MGVLRHADAGYSRAIEFAQANDIRIPTESRVRD
jgi:urocanate hydratase